MGYGNGTVGYGISGTFYKKGIPKDQENKLLNMHRDGHANAGIYVAVVLAVYLVLLTILLCRYSKRPSTESSSTSETNAASGFLSFTATKMGCGRRGIFCYLWRRRCFCSCCCPSSRTEETAQEITDYPLSITHTKNETHDKPTCV